MWTDRVRPRTAALVLLAALAACEAGTAPPLGGVGEMGADASVGEVQLRAVHLLPPVGDRYPPGADAVVMVTLFDQGTAPDALVSVSAPAAERVEVRWDRACDGTAEVDAPVLPADAGLPEPSRRCTPGLSGLRQPEERNRP